MYYLPLGTTTCRITALVVTSHAQGRGLGRQLLHEAELRARAAGAARLELSSGSQRTDAHAFYRACGYGDGTVRFNKRLGAAQRGQAGFSAPAPDGACLVEGLQPNTGPARPHPGLLPSVRPPGPTLAPPTEHHRP